MFKDAHRASQMILDDEEEMVETNPFPKPFSREFILKVNVGRPYTYSSTSPQRLFCRLTQNEFRVAGAFTLDQQFLWINCIFTLLLTTTAIKNIIAESM